MQLIEILPPDFDVDLDIRYATDANLTSRPIYRTARCFLHPQAADALLRAIRLAAALDYRLRLFDGFRPTEAQWRLWNALPDARYIADPRRGSAHSRGVAIDLVLAARDGRPLDCGTDFDDMTNRSHHGRTDIAAEALRHRTVLAGVMTGAGWEAYPYEWWHYQLPNASNFPLLADGAAAPPLLAP